MNEQHVGTWKVVWIKSIRPVLRHAAIISCLLVTVPSIAAADNPQEFKGSLLALAAYLDARTAFLHDDADPSIKSLQEKVAELTDEQLRQFSESIPDVTTFVSDVALLTAATSGKSLPNSIRSKFTTSISAFGDLVCEQDAVKDMALEEPLFPTRCFRTDYPVGDQYDLFTATAKETLNIPSFNPLDPTIEIPARIEDPTDRCNSNEEARGLLILSPLLVTAGILAEVPVVGAIAETFVIAAEIAISQCDLQDALIDGAEVEAAFENSERIILQLNALQSEVNSNNTDIQTRLDSLETSINAQLDAVLANQEEILRLIKLPLGQRKK